MGLLWLKGSTKYQKIVAAIFSVLCIGPFIWVFTRNFVIAPRTSYLAVNISLLLTAISIVVIAYLYFKNLWRPGPKYNRYSLGLKFIMIPIISGFIFILFWMNIAIAAPHLYTAVYGKDDIKKDVVIKDKGASRSGCKYRLKSNSIDSFFFRFCISERGYNQLPSGELEAELYIKKSVLGYIVNNIRVKNESR